MKKIYLMGAAALLALSTVSCVENSSKYKNVVNQNSVLQSEKADLQAEYNETLSIINDIENGFAAIRESEGKLMVDISNIEGQTPSKKEQLAVQMKQVQDIIAENKTKIKKLQARVGQNNNLKKTITRLEGEFNKEAFTQIDIRDIVSIETTGKRVKLLTSHPSDSYALEQGEDENVVIKILLPEKFWSVSKYLFVIN